MHILVQKASWRIDEAPQNLRTLHGKKGRNFVNSTQQEKEKLHKLCTTRNNNIKSL
jgi:hypothetical protein